MERRIVLLFAIVAIIVSSCAPVDGPAPAPTKPNIVSPPAPEATNTASPEPVTIQFWEWYGGAYADFFENEAVLFNKQYPWITVQVSHYPDQNAYREILSLAFESESAPDTYIRRHTFQQVYDNNWAHPLDEWINPDWVAKFPSGSFVETKNVWDGKIYTFPFYANKFERVLYINEDMFREAGLVDQAGEITVPETWNELRSMALQITKSGQGNYYGIGIGIKDPRHMGWWFDLGNLAGASGTYEIDYRTAQYTFGTTPAFSEIVGLLLGMKEDGCVYPNESALDDSNLYSFFGQGKYAMFMSGSWSASNLKRDFPEFQNYRIIPLPFPDEGRSGGLPYAPGSGSFYMSSQTKHPKESWLWLDWISSQELHKRMVSMGLDYSIYAELNTPEYITDPHKWQAYEATTKYLVLLPFPPARNPETALVRPAAVVPDLGDVLVGIYTGQITDWQQSLLDLDQRKQAAFQAAIEEAQVAGAKVSVDDFIFSDWDPMKDYLTLPK